MEVRGPPEFRGRELHFYRCHILAVHASWTYDVWLISELELTSFVCWLCTFFAGEGSHWRYGVGPQFMAPENSGGARFAGAHHENRARLDLGKYSGVMIRARWDGHAALGTEERHLKYVSFANKTLRVAGAQTTAPFGV